VSWNKRELLLFANSIGVQPEELQLLYELRNATLYHQSYLDPQFAAFPTYPLIMGFKGTEFEVINFYAKFQSRVPPGLPALDSKRAVDGERYIEIVKPIPVTSEGRHFELRRSTMGAYDKGKAGIVLEELTELVDADSGEVFTKMIGSSFFVGQGCYGGPKGPKKPSYKAPEGKQPNRVSKFKTSPGQALIYRLNGGILFFLFALIVDYNPLHADPTVGPTMGFKGILR
jgi:peroxisomal enoyl-CoA hydratase 2